VTIALYATIWIAVGLFTIGELGPDDGPKVPGSQGARVRRFQGPKVRRWAWRASLAGLTLATVHVVIALGHVHGWSHGASVAATARQTRAIFGLDWGGGVYVNYAFLLVWALELWRRRRALSPPNPGTLGPWVRGTLRVAAFVILFNAAIVFAVGWRRALGAALMIVLLWAWVLPRRT